MLGDTSHHRKNRNITSRGMRVELNQALSHARTRFFAMSGQPLAYFTKVGCVSSPTLGALLALVVLSGVTLRPSP